MSLGKATKRGLAALFLALEAISVVLDAFQKNRRASLATFVFSAFGFAITSYLYFKERTTSRVKSLAVRQLGMVEIVFSVLQLIATSTHFLLLVLDVKYNYNVFGFTPLAFAVIAFVFVFKEEDRVISSGNVSSADDSVYSISIALDPIATLVDRDNSANNLHLRSRQVKEAPGIEGFQIIGEAKPGEKLFGCGNAVNGTTVCAFQWVRAPFFPFEIWEKIEGATNSEYVVTADDVDALIALECIPKDDQGCQGEMVRVFANDSSRIKCDADMQREIDIYFSTGEATFRVLIGFPDTWKPATLILSRSSFQIKIDSRAAVVIEEAFAEDLLIEIPVGLSKQFIVKHSWAAYHFNAHNFRMRDTIVLTMRKFQSPPPRSIPRVIRRSKSRHSGKYAQRHPVHNSRHYAKDV